MVRSVKLRSLAWCQELASANFPLWAPKFLPRGFQVEEVTFRQEGSKEEYPRSSLKITAKSVGKAQSLSIKQFFYDWAPPAYDAPSLWRNHKQFPEETPAPKGTLIGDDMLWIGLNYRNQRAASLIKDRTTIEIVGDLLDDEFVSLAKHLEPLNDWNRASLLSKSFAELSYRYPNPIKAVRVPISFWHFPTVGETIKIQRAFKASDISEDKKEACLNLPADSPYKLDSLFCYEAEPSHAKIDILDFVYEHKEHPGSTIHILRVHKDSPAACTFPPEPDKTQKFSHHKIEGLDYYHAYRNDHGPHEFVFQKGDYRYLVLVKPAPWTHSEWAKKLVTQIIEG